LGRKKKAERGTRSKADGEGGCDLRPAISIANHGFLLNNENSVLQVALWRDLPPCCHGFQARSTAALSQPFQ
jgi:hypothetical protein